MKINFHLLIVFLIAIIFFVPFLINPSNLTQRNTDLGRTYMSQIIFFRNSVLENKEFSLWKPDQLMGETYVGNPVSTVLYPGNFLFLIFSPEFASILFYLIHFILAGLFTFSLARSFSFKNDSSLAAALFYMFSTKMIVHLSAGHFTMIAAFSYFPLIFLSLRKILQNETKSLIWPITAAVAITLSYICYPTIAFYSILFAILYLAYYLILHNSKFRNFSNNKNILLQIALLAVATFGLSAVAFFPHLELSSLSTRSQLTIEDVAIPLWNFKRFVSSLILPYLNFSDLDSESFLYLGIVPTILFFSGFLRLSLAKKVAFSLIGILTLFFVLGLSTPVFPLAYKVLPFLKYSRVTTRLWFIIALLISLIAAVGLERIKNYKIKYLFLSLFLIESYLICTVNITNYPFIKIKNFRIYDYLENDSSIFRVYCTTYCFDQQEMSKRRINVLHGENPIQQSDFIKFLQNAGGYRNNKFAVIFPPYWLWKNVPNPPVPSSYLLGLANVKYIASTYQISHPDFVFIDKFESAYLYRNTKFMKRAYFKNSQDNVEISEYKPNHIKISFEKSLQNRELILADNYYPGWYYFMNNRKFKVEKEEPVFRKITITPNTESVELKYQPESYKIGKSITTFSVLVILMYFWYIRYKKSNG